MLLDGLSAFTTHIINFVTNDDIVRKISSKRYLIIVIEIRLCIVLNQIPDHPTQLPVIFIF